MATISEAFSTALKHYHAGHLREAEGICADIIAADSSYASVWHLWGVLKAQLGQLELAIEFLQRSLSLAPNNAIAQYDLGVAFGDLSFTDRNVPGFSQVEMSPWVDL